VPISSTRSPIWGRSTCLANPEIESPHALQDQALVFGIEALKNFPTPVCAALIHHDHFKPANQFIFERQHPSQTYLDDVLLVIDRLEHAQAK
jgi:hypothetical protein